MAWQISLVLIRASTSDGARTIRDGEGSYGRRREMDIFFPLKEDHAHPLKLSEIRPDRQHDIIFRHSVSDHIVKASERSLNFCITRPDQDERRLARRRDAQIRQFLLSA